LPKSFTRIYSDSNYFFSVAVKNSYAESSQ